MQKMIQIISVIKLGMNFRGQHLQISQFAEEKTQWKTSPKHCSGGN